MTFDIDLNGMLCIKNQVTDYSAHGNALRELCLIDFFINTYEVPTSSGLQSHSHDLIQQLASYGHSKHTRVPYLMQHPCHHMKTHVVRPAHHNILPNFIGHYFSHSNDEEVYDFYCASMLCLFKPWCNLSGDLKLDEESWSSTLENLTAVLSTCHCNMIDNIQYFHECESSAHTHWKEQTNSLTDHTENQSSFADEESAWDQMLSSWNDEEAEEGNPSMTREELHGWLAVKTTKEANIFPHNLDEINFLSASQLPPHRATENDLNMLKIWQAHLDNKEEQFDSEDPMVHTTDAEVIHTALTNVSLRLHNVPISSAPAEKPLQAIEPKLLNTDQQRAHDIVAWHLDHTLSGYVPPPL